jgi:hypothetical protein
MYRKLATILVANGKTVPGWTSADPSGPDPDD